MICDACKSGKSIAPKKHDAVNHPKHYLFFPDMEAIDIISKVLTPIELAGFLKGNALKYRLRLGDKHSDLAEDLGKSNWYRDRLKKLREDSQ